MTRIRSIITLLLIALFAVPAFAARGKADFTRFVALGDSYGAGYESSSLNERHQVFGWPTIIAKQVGLPICPTNAAITDLCFAIPLISYPGIGPESILTPAGPIPGSGQGNPLMLGFGRPFNNLSVPGYTVGAALTLTGAEATSGLGQVILRGLGSEVDQAIRLQPTFIALWLGGNDFLGPVSVGNPAGLPSVATFTAQYNAMLDKLTQGAPNAGFVIGTLPESFGAAPLTASLPSVVFDSNFQPVIVGGQTFPLIYTPTGGAPGPVPPGSVILLSALPRYQTGVGIPPQLKSSPPFNQLPNAGTPLNDADVLTPAKLQLFATAVAGYNGAIRAAGARLDIPVADIKGLFDRFAAASAATPMQLGPFGINKSFVRGGLFSLDGFHLTDIGYTLFANEYIKTINSAYGTRIPLANVSQLLQNNDPALTSTKGGFTISEEAARQMLQIFTSVQMPAPPRRRAGNH